MREAVVLSVKNEPQLNPAAMLVIFYIFFDKLTDKLLHITLAGPLV